jgi:hypothetical protein
LAGKHAICEEEKGKDGIGDLLQKQFENRRFIEGRLVGLLGGNRSLVASHLHIPGLASNVLLGPD